MLLQHREQGTRILVFLQASSLHPQATRVKSCLRLTSFGWKNPQEAIRKPLLKKPEMVGNLQFRTGTHIEASERKMRLSQFSHPGNYLTPGLYVKQKMSQV